MKLLWLDDERNPHKNDWLNLSPIPKHEITEVIWVKTFTDFCRWIIINGLPDGVCFDHDLGVRYPKNAKELVANGGKFIETTTGTYIEGTIELPTGYDCARWLSNYCLDNNLQLPLFKSQSANREGRENILSYLNNHIKNYELC